WLTASDSGDGWSLPFDAAGEEQPEPVVVEVAEAVAGSAGVLDEQVHGLGGAVAGAVGGVEGEKLVGPAVDGRGEPDQLGHIGLRAPLEERDQASAGVVDVDSAEHGPQELLGQQGGADLAPAVTSVEATLQSSPAPVVEVLAGHEQQPADPVDGSPLRPRCPRVSCWVRRRTSSTAWLARRTTWNRSSTSSASRQLAMPVA